MHSKATCRPLLASTALSILFTSGIAFQAHAQESASTLVLDTITISSRKQDEKDLTLPIATTILTPDQIGASTLDPLSEIARQTPGTVFVDYGRFGENYLTMRGTAVLGSAQNPLDNTVGFSTNEIPTSLSGINAPMLDVDHVEILKGPQGTTFGRNALGGSINIVTKPADGKREVRVDTEIGTDGFGFVQGTVGGWILPDKVAGRGVIRLEKFDGDIPNTVLGGDDGASRIGAARGTLRFTPDSTLTIDISGDYSRNRNSNPSNILLETDDFPLSGQDIRPFNQQTIGGGSVKISKEFDTFSLTSTTSLQDIRVRSNNDFTDSLLYSAYLNATGMSAYLPYYNYFNDTSVDKLRFRDHERIFNQEVRLNSLDSEPLKWVVGANYFRSTYSLNRDMNSTLYPTLNGFIDNDITSQTVALFGDTSMPLGERWEVSGGLRLAYEDQRLDGNYTSNGFPGTVPSLSQSGKYSDTYLTGRAALSYKWTDEIISYASIAHGYSSGGFEKATTYAPYGVVQSPFDPATSWTYELGSKALVTDWLRINGALFYNDVSNGLLTSFDNATLTAHLTNQDYRSYGFEASATATLLGGLDLTGGFSVIQSKLVNVTPESVAAGAAEGNKVPQVPSFSANIGLDYTFSAEQIGVPGEFKASVNYQYVGVRYSDVANTGKLDPYNLVNAKIGWQKDNVNLYVFANNLLDERPVYYAVPITTGVSAAYVGRGRVLGLGLSTQW